MQGKRNNRDLLESDAAVMGAAGSAVFGADGEESRSELPPGIEGSRGRFSGSKTTD